MLVPKVKKWENNLGLVNSQSIDETKKDKKSTDLHQQYSTHNLLWICYLSFLKDIIVFVVKNWLLEEKNQNEITK